jgi:hypothetical protein
MHPPLTPENHPLCLDVITALKDCHHEQRWGKFLGACNEQKWQLDACFKAEKAVKRSINLEKARVEQKRLLERKQADRERG